MYTFTIVGHQQKYTIIYGHALHMVKYKARLYSVKTFLNKVAQSMTIQFNLHMHNAQMTKHFRPVLMSCWLGLSKFSVCVSSCIIISSDDIMFNK